MNKKTLDRIFMIFVFVNIADLLLTITFWESEINPLVLHAGKPAFIIIKFVSVLLFYTGIQLYDLKEPLEIIIKK